MKQLRFLVTPALIALLSLSGCSNSRTATGERVTTDRAADTSIHGAPRAAGDDTRWVENAISNVYPALVRIYVTKRGFTGGREISRMSAGSGVVISENGYVVTNHHVAGDARHVYVTMSSKEKIPATLVGTDPLTDIAVIKLAPPEPRKFAFARFGDSGKLKRGDKVLAMGSPGALRQSVTLGIVSNPEGVIPGGGGSLAGERVGSVVRWIFHDAAIYHGNSGGPLVNERGEVIGINEIGVAGLGGAIPSNIAKYSSTQIIAHGRVPRRWSGMVCQKMLHSDPRSGILLSGVIKGSPAEKCGLKAGDLIVAYNGTPVDVRFAEQMPLFNWLALNTPKGKPIGIELVRDGQKITVTMNPLEREKPYPDQAVFETWGITASNISKLMARGAKRDTTEGVYVRTTRPGGPASEAKPALKPGDIILTVGGRKTNKVSVFITITESIVRGAKKPVPTVVEFERQGASYATLVEVGIQPLRDPSRNVQKAWLPVSTQVFTRKLAKGMGLKGTKGVRITRVFPESEAEKAGFKVGDIIVKIDDDAVEASEPHHRDVFPAMVRRHRVGSDVAFTVLRDKKETTIKIKLPRNPRPPREMKKYRDDAFLFTVRDMAELDKVARKLAKKAKGVLVDSVESGGWASLGGLSSGDIILKIDGNAVKTIRDVKNRMKEIEQKKPAYVVLFVRRGITTRFLELEPGWDTK